jgi:hypothetical protein
MSRNYSNRSISLAKLKISSDIQVIVKINFAFGSLFHLYMLIISEVSELFWSRISNAESKQLVHIRVRDY